ncbi:MAG: c-type cytochrome, partial [Verrucomicrobia bacterium]|nr:c-type cytochrome [Verrucomicrobiota bacterium]
MKVATLFQFRLHPTISSAASGSLAAVVMLCFTVSGSGAEPTEASLAPGKTVYEQHCAACHGINGDGNGPAAVWLYPKPRNFSAGLFKIQSTPAGSLPTDEDLFQTATRGMASSSMPSFTYLTEQQRRDAIRYVKWLTAEILPDGSRRNRFDEAKAKGGLKPPVVVPPEPAASVDALAKGKETFVKLGCIACHGEHGQGDGPSAPTLKDSFGLPLLPRDFTIGAFRGGSEGRDLYLRIQNGLAGTPMLGFGPEVLKAEDRWALVQFIQSLRRKDAEVNDILKPDDTNIHAKRVKQLPFDPMDDAWERFDTVRVPLNPLWPEPYPVSAVAVTALHDGKTLAILCQWKDASVNGAPVRVQDFQDAVALQFSMNGTTPFLGMGDRDNPVNIWQWKAGWQQEAEGHRQDVHEQYPSMHVDFYFAHATKTAELAGNLIAVPHTSPVEDANARGFGTFRSQPLSQQNVKGKGIWHDGFWNVVFYRELKSKEADDVKFVAGKAVPLAFA